MRTYKSGLCSPALSGKSVGTGSAFVGFLRAATAFAPPPATGALALAASSLAAAIMPLPPLAALPAGESDWTALSPPPAAVLAEEEGPAAAAAALARDEEGPAAAALADEEAAALVDEEGPAAAALVDEEAAAPSESAIVFTQIHFTPCSRIPPHSSGKEAV
jgi:hypothetical protein